MYDKDGDDGDSDSGHDGNDEWLVAIAVGIPPTN